MMKTKNFFLTFAAIIGTPLLLNAYVFPADDTQVDWSEAIGSYTQNANVLISGPSSGAYGNSWVYISQNLSMANNNLKVNQGGVLKAEGAYTLTLGSLTLSNGRNEDSNQASNMVFKGVSAGQELTLNMMATGASGTLGRDGNTGSALLELAGNTKFSAVNNNGTFYIGGVESGSFVGTATMHIYGGNNTATFNSFNIGQNSTTGRANLIIQGSDESVTANNAFRFYGANGTNADDIKGGAISFVADMNGISALSLGNFADAGKIVMTGVILLDLSEFAFVSDTASFQLISTANSYALSAIENWILSAGTDNLFAVIGGEYDSDDWQLEAKADGLWVNVTREIPEPSAFVAVLGIFALALAAYRRKK